MGVLFQTTFCFADADAVEEVENAFAGGFAGDGFVVDAQGFCELGADFHEGIQRGHGLLEDEADASAAQAAEGFFVCIEDGCAVEGDARVLSVTGTIFGQEAHEGHGGNGFAGTGFADEGEGFAFGDFEADVAHGVDGFFVELEADVEVFDGE